MQKHCDVSSLTMRWFKSNIAMFQIEHRNVFLSFHDMSKNGLTCYRVTFLVNFWCITEILRNFGI